MTVCPECGSCRVQICMPAWFEANGDLEEAVDLDYDARPTETFCPRCYYLSDGDTTLLLAGNYNRHIMNVRTRSPLSPLEIERRLQRIDPDHFSPELDVGFVGATVIAASPDVEVPK